MADGTYRSNRKDLVNKSFGKVVERKN